MKTINYYIAKSLTGTGILVFLLMAFSCTQESISTDFGNGPEIYEGSEMNAVYAKGMKARPIKGDVSFVLDSSNPPVLQCDFGPPIPLFSGLVSGNVSHLGKLQPGQSPEGDEPISGSYITPKLCDSSGFPTVIVEYYGVNVAANGDQLKFRSVTTLQFDPIQPDGSTSGTAIATGEYDGGDGRFVGASGTFIGAGSFSEGKVQLELEGTIIY